MVAVAVIVPCRFAPISMQMNGATRRKADGPFKKSRNTMIEGTPPSEIQTMAIPSITSGIKVCPGAGDFVCFLGKNKKISGYGILAKNLPAIATCGTYVVPSSDPKELAGTLLVMDRKELHVAWLRLNNQDPSSPFTAELPKELLKTIYARQMANPRLLAESIIKLENEYNDNMAVVAKEVFAAKEAKRKAAKTNPKKPTTKRSPTLRAPPIKWNIGTKLAAFFENADLYKGGSAASVAKVKKAWELANAHDKKKVRKGWMKDGETFNGVIASTFVTDANARMYKCVFETPMKDTLDLDERRTKALAEHYLELQASSSESDGLSTPSDTDTGSRSPASDSTSRPNNERATFEVGTGVRTPSYEIGRTYETKITYHDGEVTALRHVYNCGELVNQEFRCSFPTRSSLTNWFGPAETATMADAYTKSHPLSNPPPPKRLSPKSKSQQQMVNEACGVINRKTLKKNAGNSEMRMPKADTTGSESPHADVVADDTQFEAALKAAPYTAALYTYDNVTGRYVSGNIASVHYVTDMATKEQTVMYACFFNTSPRSYVTQKTREDIMGYLRNIKQYMLQEDVSNRKDGACDPLQSASAKLVAQETADSMHSEPTSSLEDVLGEQLRSESLPSMKAVAEEMELETHAEYKRADTPVHATSYDQVHGADDPLQSNLASAGAEDVATRKEEADESEKQADTSVTDTGIHQHAASAPLAKHDVIMVEAADDPLKSNLSSAVAEDVATRKEEANESEKQADTSVTGTDNQQHAASSTLVEHGADNTLQSAHATLEENVVEHMDDDIVEETDEIEQPRPTGLYEPGQKELRRLVYDCPTCGDPADGSHQCGVCFVHIHVFCSNPYPGTEEGYGQVRLCHECSLPDKDETGGEPLPSAAGTSFEGRKSPTDMDAEERTRQNEDREGIIRGNYPVQDIFKTYDYLHKYGLGQYWGARKPLPAILPTFYVDGEQKHEAVVKANGGKSEGRALRKAAEKKLMLAWQSADSSRQFESNKALRKAYKRHLKATQVSTSTLDTNHAEELDESISGSTADKMRTIQAATILNALVTQSGLNNKVDTAASAPKTKKRKKKKPPVTESLTEDKGISTHKRRSEPNEVPTSKKARKTLAAEIMKEVSKIMAKQNVIPIRVKAKSKKMPVKQNGRLQNWKHAMRRNILQDQVEKSLLPFTIRRTKLHTVSAQACL
jgi:hypothetical protein